jgi:hypothetical protein
VHTLVHTFRASHPTQCSCQPVNLVGELLLRGLGLEARRIGSCDGLSSRIAGFDRLLLLFVCGAQLLFSIAAQLLCGNALSIGVAKISAASCFALARSNAAAAWSALAASRCSAAFANAAAASWPTRNRAKACS